MPTLVVLRKLILAPVFVVASLVATVAASATTTTPPQCPAGKVPNWDNSACIAVGQPYTLSGYGLPTQQKAVPQGGLNGAPAMHDCNGIPIPLSVPCSAASQSMITQSPAGVAAAYGAAQSAAVSTAATKQPSIIVVAGGPPGSGTLSATVSTGTDSTSQLVSLLGDWYSGWLQYLAAAFNFDINNLQQISSTFLRLAPCFSGQASDCESAIWQQIGPWVGGATSGN